MSRADTVRGRTVHPMLAAAVVQTLAARGLRSRLAADVEARIAAGSGVAERHHTRLLRELCAAGWLGMREAAERLLGTGGGPLAVALGTSSSVPTLAARAQLVERWLHVGHGTRAMFTDRDVTVRHGSALGGPPQLAETLFACALYVAGVARVVTSAPTVELLGGAAISPQQALHVQVEQVRGWRLRWDEPLAELATPARPLDEVRRQIALEPARPWRLAEAAGRLRVAPRTLQRSLACEGSTFQAELVGIRLDVASQLIIRTDVALADVAAAAGFADHAHMTRHFRSRFGHTPSEFRSRPQLRVAPAHAPGRAVRGTDRAHRPAQA